jgi:cytoskeletal protein RodZ
MTTLGDMLIEARKEAGLSAHDIAQRTRIMQATVYNLEDDNYKALPAAGYVRGYILSYCKACGVDPNPYLEQFERQSGSNRRDSISEQPYSYGREVLPRKSEHELNWKVVLIAAAVIVGIVAAIYLLSQSGSDSEPGLNPLPAETTAAANANPEEQTPEDELTPFSLNVEARDDRASDVHIAIDGSVAFDGSLTSGNSQTFENVREAEIEIASPENVRVEKDGSEVSIPDNGILVLAVPAD